MPLFVFLSGSFVRPFSRQLLIKTFVTLVMPLVFSAKIQNVSGRGLTEKCIPVSKCLSNQVGYPSDYSLALNQRDLHIPGHSVCFNFRPFEARACRNAALVDKALSVFVEPQYFHGLFANLVPRPGAAKVLYLHLVPYEHHPCVWVERESIATSRSNV